METSNRHITHFSYPLMAIGLLALTFLLIREAWVMAAFVVIIPFVTLYMFIVFNRPYIGLVSLFILNYFFIGILRYVNLQNVSVLMDAFIVFLLVCMIIKTLCRGEILWYRANNKLLYASLLWMVYAFLELFNPSGMVEAWFFMRGAFYHFTLMIILTSVLFNKTQHIKNILFMLSILTLIAIAKVLMQRYMGFDAGEKAWLAAGSAKTHIIASGIRYFSFFSDAGNFGSNMGMAAILYMILSFYITKPSLQWFYRFVSVCSFYAMFLSGTRGAMIVPLGGMAMFILLNKNIRYIIGGSILLLLIYLFFAHTNILSSNRQIHRMRTAFRPSEDASFNVRKKNQQILAKYMVNKPFGEGVGLAGVENQRFSIRFTTLIPTDSHFVNIWVQYGVVGLCLHIGILLFITGYSGYIIMFRIQDRELKGMLIAMNCGLWGMILSAYGNSFFWQYPTAYITYMFQTFLVLGESYDKELTDQKKLEKQV